MSAVRENIDATVQPTLTHKQITDNLADFRYYQQLVNDQLAEPRSCFLTVKGTACSRMSQQHWEINVTFDGDFKNLQEFDGVRVDFAEGEEIGLVLNLLVQVVEAEKVCGPVDLEASAVFVAGDRSGVKLSPMLRKSKSYNSTGIKAIIALIGRISTPGVSDGTQYLSSISTQTLQLVETLAETSDTQSTLTWLHTRLQAIAHIPELNTHLREEQDNDSIVRSQLAELLTQGLTFVICMNKKCPGQSLGQFQICNMHIFCGEACLKAVKVEKGCDSTSCPLCPGKPKRISWLLKKANKTMEQKPMVVCHCGKQVSSSQVEWQLQLFASAKYEQALKCCSKECFLLLQTEPKTREDAEEVIEEEKMDTVEELEPGELTQTIRCLACHEPVTEESLKLACKSHGFCSTECYHIYKQNLIPQELSFWPICFHCMNEEEKDLLELKQFDDTVELRSFLNRIWELKQTYIEVQNNENFSNVIDARHELVALSYNQDYLKPAPASLSFHKVYSDVFYLSCCCCFKDVFVHFRSMSEMRTWTDRPMLLKCEIKVHAVCSSLCFNTIQNRGLHCPICPEFLLDYSLTEVDRLISHPTQEVVRRIPTSLCYCKKKESFIPLTTCSHEVCKECLASHLIDQPSNWYACPVCHQLASKDELMKSILD